MARRTSAASAVISRLRNIQNCRANNKTELTSQQSDERRLQCRCLQFRPVLLMDNQGRKALK